MTAEPEPSLQGYRDEPAGAGVTRGHRVSRAPKAATHQARRAARSLRSQGNTVGCFVSRGLLGDAPLSAPVDEVGGHDDGTR